MVPGRLYNVRFVLGALRQSWWLLLLPVLVAGALAVTLARALPNVYYSQATVVILPQRIPEAYVRSTVTVSLAQRLQTTREQVLSRSHLELMIDQFNLFPKLRQRVPMDALVVWLRTGLYINLVKPDTFIVGCAGYEPEKIQQIADYLTRQVIRESMREREMLADSTSEFLEAELASARERLQAQEGRVEEYRRRYAGELPSQLDANLRILQSTSVQLQGVVDALHRDRERREELARELAAVTAVDTGEGEADAEEGGDGESVKGADGGRTPAPRGSAPAQLRAARASRQKLLLRLTPEHPDIQALDRTIAALERVVAGQPLVPETKPAPIDSARAAQLRDLLRTLDEQIAGREASERRLRSAVTEYQARVEAVPQREAEWIQLTRDYNTLQGVYTSLLAKHEESRIAANLERQQIGEQFKVVERPSVPSKPISPKRPAIVLMGLGIGIAIGLALLVIRELRDRTLRTEEEVAEALKLPVVGLVPVIVTAWDRRRLRKRRFIWSAAVLALCVGAAALRWVR
jgi:polysaccharide chain length determinant protein (PEP-CTERM system associated)